MKNTFFLFTEKIKNYYNHRNDVFQKFTTFIYACMSILVLGNVFYFIKELFTDPGHYELYVLRVAPLIAMMMAHFLSKKYPYVLKYSALVINAICGVGIMFIAVWDAEAGKLPSAEGVILYYTALGLSMGPCLFSVLGHLIGVSAVTAFSYMFIVLSRHPGALGYDPTIQFSELGPRCIVAGVFGYVLGVIFSLAMFIAYYHLYVSEVRLKSYINKDPLCDTYNRLWIQNHEPIKDCIIGIIDCDKFKQINDTYGHHIGDEVLRANSNLIKMLLNEDEAIARYGGDEFILILNKNRNTSLFMDRVNRDLERYYCGKGYKSTVSIGFAYVEVETSVEDALKVADKYLYELKNLKKLKDKYN